MLTGNNGILTRASESKQRTEEETDIEKIRLAVSEAQIGKKGYQDLNQNNLQNAIDNQFGKEQANVIDNGDNTFSVSVLDSKKTYTLNVDGNIEYNSNLLINNVKIGDYVNYIPDKVSEPYQLENVGHDGEIFQEELNWRVLSINEGKVILISDTATTSEITLSGEDGYNNGVYVLNDLCKTLYSKSGIAISRSINENDIDNVSTFNKSSFINDEGIAYGETKQYTEDWYKYCPNLYNSALDDSVQTANTYPTLGHSQDTSKPLTIKNTGYQYTLKDYITGLNYELIKKDYSYWLASRFSYCLTARPYFGLKLIAYKDDLFYCSNLYVSNNVPNASTSHIVPIIEINPGVEIDKQNPDKNGSSKELAWEILE